VNQVTRAGFTLIEILVVMTIIAILAALSLPSYHAYVVRAKRAQAQAALLQLLQQQERFYSQNNTYIVFSSSSGDPHERLFKWWSGATAAESAYEVSAAACPGATIGQCVQLSAVPGTDKVDRNFRDSACATLAVTSSGLKTASGAAAHCWP
jgi:type IV pilus assembly protein PilE